VPHALRAPKKRVLLPCVALLLLGAAVLSVPGARGDAPPGDAAVAVPAPGAPAWPLALWVLAEGSQRVLERPERIPALVDDARALGATDLFVQVYRRGVAWWPSGHAEPAASWREARAARAAGGAEPGSDDPLRRLIDAAHGAGLRVHAWMNVLSLADNPEAAVVEALGPRVLHVDRRGRSILAYPEGEMPPPDAPHLRMGTPALWLDPAAPGLSDWYAALVTELLGRYPDLDGLHLDYIRYPDVLPFSPGSRFGVGMGFGYGPASRARFREETGLEAPLGDRTAHAREWDDWRRAQVTALVARLREALHAAAPATALSAAVFAYAERAYLSVYQDWLGWLEAGLLEMVVPMLYTRDDRMLRYQAAAFAGGIGGDRVWTGLGAWLFRRDPERAAAQLRAARGLGVAGGALFSWDAIADSPPLRAALAREARRVAGR